jgi:DNA-binding transcriptional LysR family regulator
MKPRRNARVAPALDTIGVSDGDVAPKNSHRRDAKSQQSDALAVVESLHWDDLRVVLAAARTGSFRKAATAIGKDIATVVRRIRRIEADIGEKLFQILPNGVVVTPTGKAVASAALEIEKTFFDLARDLECTRPQQNGIVRIAITEGLGAYWVMPKLVEFQRAFPRLTIDLRCAMESVDVLRHEADIAIQFIRPESPELIVTKLGRLHTYPFASREFIRMYGMPSNVEELKSSRLIVQEAQQVRGAWEKLVDLPSIENIVGIITNSSSAILYAIEKGGGIGGLPTYAVALGAEVVPVDVGIKHHFDIWLTYHPSLRDVDRIATVISWLRRIFSPEHYPWFRDEFIHPDKLKDMIELDPDLRTASNYRATLLR